ncbi:MAG: 5'-nucleotidase, partial [Acidobacteriota bacterium]
PNKILTFSLPGSTLQSILDYSVSRKGTDFFLQVSGLRFSIDSGHARDVEVRNHEKSDVFEPLDPERTYSVAVPDYLAEVADGYRAFFDPLDRRDTGKELRAEVQSALEAQKSAAERDGRIRSSQ